MPGVRFGEVGATEALDQLIRADRTAAVIIEPLQAEGGVLPVAPEFLAALRKLCDERDALLIFDEVQVGLGRTGTLWAYEQAGIEPDLMAIAKPLAGGLPMGAVLLTERVASAIQPGDHATTVGGGPLVASAALAVCQKVGDPTFLAEVRRKGELLSEGLGGIAMRQEKAVAIRGVGMILGLELTFPAAELVSRAMEAKLLLCPAGPNVMRVVPPLTTSDEDLTKGLSILEGAL